MSSRGKKGHKHYTQLPGYIAPTKKMVQKAKHALSIPPNIRLPRCMAKNIGFIRIQEKAGDFSHSEKDHICDECRCKFRAGAGTNHLGYGYCISHEHSVEYRRTAKKMAEAHQVAIRQGYGDGRAYEYAHVNPEGYIAKIREIAEDAGGMTDLREDIILMRTEIQKILDSYREEGKFMKTVKVSKGFGASKEDSFESIEVDDVEKVKLLTALMRTLSKMSVDNLRLTENDVVTHDQVLIWSKGILALIDRMSPSTEFRDEFVGEFAKLLNNVKTGRK